MEHAHLVELGHALDRLGVDALLLVHCDIIAVVVHPLNQVAGDHHAGNLARGLLLRRATELTRDVINEHLER